MHVLVRRDREAARRHLTLLDSLPETLILVLDRELRIQTASGEALARRGHRPDAIIGLTLDDVAAPEHAAGLRAHYQAGLDGKRHQFVYTASEEHTYTIDVVPIEGADGEIASVMAIGREHLVYGRADQWDSERLRALIENVPGAVYRCAPDHEGAMTFISGHVESISGWAPAEFLGDAGRSYASIIHPDDRADVAAEVARASAERRPFVCEYRILTRGGATRWVRERGQAIRSADDQAVMFLDGAIFAIEEGGRRLAA
jgi:PAS domain S-box-containing protein